MVFSGNPRDLEGSKYLWKSVNSSKGLMTSKRMVPPNIPILRRCIQGRKRGMVYKIHPCGF